MGESGFFANYSNHVVYYISLAIDNPASHWTVIGYNTILIAIQLAMLAPGTRLRLGRHERTRRLGSIISERA